MKESMHWGPMLLAGFVATGILTTMLTVVQELGLTRMDLPVMLGTMVTANRRRARIIGFLMHFVLGWGFSILYILIFRITGDHQWWLGMIIGFVHATFLLSVGMKLLPSLHPRMASEEQGPDPTRQLEPPGPFALNYGQRTPLATYLAHMMYGIVLCLFYR